MKSKLAIVDVRAGHSIIESLFSYADDVFPFSSNGITYESISCHPDIFIYKDNNHIILAPNTPETVKSYLQEKRISYEEGISKVGVLQSDSCFYNCVSTPYLFFHKAGYSDPLVLERNEGKKFINLTQSYTRCSMLPIDNDHYITSDPGIHHTLEKIGLTGLLFSPNEIRIVEYKYGFIGGTCGIYEDKIIFLGNPLKHKDGKELISFIEKNGKECISLGNDYLYDGGGIFFL